MTSLLPLSSPPPSSSSSSSSLFLLSRRSTRGVLVGRSPAACLCVSMIGCRWFSGFASHPSWWHMMCVCRVVVVVVLWQCRQSITIGTRRSNYSSNYNFPPSLSFSPTPFPNALHSPLVIVLPSLYIDRRHPSSSGSARVVVPSTTLDPHAAAW